MLIDGCHPELLLRSSHDRAVISIETTALQSSIESPIADAEFEALALASLVDYLQMSSTLSTHLLAAQQLLRANQIQAAELQLRQALKLDPQNSSALSMLGVVLLKSGRLDEAESILREVHEKHPQAAEPMGLLAVICLAKSDPNGAASMFRLMIASGHESADVQNQLGSCYLQLGDYVSASSAFKRAIEMDRNAAHSYFNLGMALKSAGSSFETFTTFQRSIELNPNFVDAYVELWHQMRLQLNWREGLPILEEGLARHPQSVQLQLALASTYGKVGQADQASRLFQKAMSSDPAAATLYAHWLQEEGQFEPSIPVLKESIRRKPLQGQAYYNLTIAKCFELDNRSLIEEAKPLLENASINLDEKMFLQYALAKSFEQRKDFESAMHHYDQANSIAYQLFNSEITHDGPAVDREQQLIRELFSADALNRLRKLGSKSETPIFIVGMIRTGTTLLDQILAAHPDVKSEGEQPFWQISAGRANRRLMELGAQPGDFRELEERYLAVLNGTTRGSRRITDKMPTNFMHIGLMSSVFPRAKFIHMRRSPLDTCLSIYTTFLGSGTQFAYHQDNILEYYRAYLRTMEHWRAVISPEQMIEVDYEELVSDKERVLRQLLPFCGLEWDDACLTHEQVRSQVSTPSLWTARQPVNTASVERWRKFEPWLGKLLELRSITHPVSRASAE